MCSTRFLFRSFSFVMINEVLKFVSDAISKKIFDLVRKRRKMKVFTRVTRCSQNVLEAYDYSYYTRGMMKMLVILNFSYIEIRVCRKITCLRKWNFLLHWLVLYSLIDFEFTLLCRLVLQFRIFKLRIIL